jgi:hypothetical protein
VKLILCSSEAHIVCCYTFPHHLVPLARLLLPQLIHTGSGVEAGSCYMHISLSSDTTASDLMRESMLYTDRVNSIG